MELFERKTDCCGCEACVGICPNGAIAMKPDTGGFLYPSVDEELCLECGLCKKNCAFGKEAGEAMQPLAVYAAVARDVEELDISSSGGAFAALAAMVFEKNGVVIGCAYNQSLQAEHICVNEPGSLTRLQGTKYVQSRIKRAYLTARNQLMADRWVLFTGTPCQIAGLKAYLGRDYPNLLTADVVCRGVPSAAFLRGYIDYLEYKVRGKILEICFRDKEMGWGLAGRYVYDKGGRIRAHSMTPRNSYYYNYFLNGDSYRDSCYECPYAGGRRQSDFTLGDYWGIEKAHPEIHSRDGVSLLIVNSAKGMVLVNRLREYVELTESDLFLAGEENPQLTGPVEKSEQREAILRTWRKGGYMAVASEFESANRNRTRRSGIQLPQPARMIKNLFVK